MLHLPSVATPLLSTRRCLRHHTSFKDTGIFCQPGPNRGSSWAMRRTAIKSQDDTTNPQTHHTYIYTHMHIRAFTQAFSNTHMHARCLNHQSDSGPFHFPVHLSIMFSVTTEVTERDEVCAEVLGLGWGRLTAHPCLKHLLDQWGVPTGSRWSTQNRTM